MCNWVKFSDRLPTKSDANFDNEVFIQCQDGTRSTACLDHIDEGQHLPYPDWFWLENTPDTPKPRTLEDVVRDYLTTTFDRRSELEKEMKEILEKGLDNQDS